jgi:hypothetical protein
MQHRVIEGESLQDVVNWMRVLTTQFSGVWADNSYGTSSTLRIQSKAPSWAFSDISLNSGVARAWRLCDRMVPASAPLAPPSFLKY